LNLQLGTLKLLERATLAVEELAGGFVLEVLVVAVLEKTFDDVAELGVLLQRFGEVLLPLSELWIGAGQYGREEQGGETAEKGEEEKKEERTIVFVKVYPASTAIPTFSVASSSPPSPSSPILNANPFNPPPISPQSPAASVHRFMSLRLTFSSDPARCDENLLVNASESRKRWSGC
jgi:hypothetical protein